MDVGSKVLVQLLCDFQMLRWYPSLCNAVSDTFGQKGVLTIYTTIYNLHFDSYIFFVILPEENEPSSLGELLIPHIWRVESWIE